MRNESEMYRLILDVAKKDSRIRIVAMNGSRVNKKAVKDEFQDYDIVYLVDNINAFIDDQSWIDVFGKRIIMQTPEAMQSFPKSFPGWFTYLMLFEDGNRIDLLLVPISDLQKYLAFDPLIEILLDKDNQIKEIPISSDDKYQVKKPTEIQYIECCNEFWWITTYVVKGIKRNEFFYASKHIQWILQEQLLLMLSWNVGIDYEFEINVGNMYKYLQRYLEPEIYERVKACYDIRDIEHCERALLLLMELFRETSKRVGKEMMFDYPDYDEKTSKYIANKLK
ncbi:aminoglycoside 6-adenylyltransferase [Breznakia sp. PF5-3]|uniref:aminoglycoside 6-adenylyltransferase n=1 Tax=unclassified Breznakia TaxID=2623764 RepID=UPI002404CE95|nr:MULTISPECIES: aminoglycoside 6-adenylyltransferase [unclassified Breznakia]MDL2276503.1 aminoglycoside 6-adenylyltransferase [Breznakia sp. OttesenSCG-928-G09]MDF9824257.1 aminoglycoside 6-adenylyltransferase [Breznakia sp. PM6-1]MDF9835176.1 aminoglycoside 6-adenylyltransferase [Breznakia sp. PF5-3]MDF9837288.1 aminoglycoside 6-adenylyltransferase [Breznakia sp. PFB2-8]MDF9859423.1 aminoglycoside 6-adenylyltransferase [Breznakia sp. PH5-24]